MRAALFPGQGIEAGVVLKALDPLHPLTVQASEMLGYDLRRRVEQASRRPRGVMPTALAQPAIFVAGLLSFEKTSDSGEGFSHALGHSLGEYTALVAAGAMSFRHGLALVATRGSAMQKAASRTPGAMAAVIGLGLHEVEGLADDVGVTVANDNSSNQVVISGDPPALATAAAAVRDAGGRCVLLPIEGAFHSDAMRPAASALSRALFTIEIRNPSIPVVSNITAKPYRSPGEIRRLLERQLTERVRFRGCVHYLQRVGVRDFIDIGPGDVVGRIAAADVRSSREPVDV